MTTVEKQLELGSLTFSNEEGVRRALEQLGALDDPAWRVRYDRRQDTLFMRRPDNPPAVSYWAPEEPEIVFRLDPHSGALVGLDLVDFAGVLSRRHPPLRRALWIFRVGRLLDRVPALRPLARDLLQAIDLLARKRVRRAADDLSSSLGPHPA